MFERYTEKARRVIFFARYEASQFGSRYIETEHFLLGLLREDRTLVNRFLQSYGEVDAIRRQIEGRGTVREKVSTSVDLPLSHECKRILAYGAEESERLRHKHIGTEHLLIGVLKEEKCYAAELLRERGLRIGSVRAVLAGGPPEVEALAPAESAPRVADPVRFERFTEGAMRAALFAYQEASELGSATIDVEHLLLGVLREDKLDATRVLRSDAALESIRREIEEHNVPDDKIPPGDDLLLTREYQSVLAFASEESERLGHKNVETGHLLLGILNEEHSLACEILNQRGGFLAAVRAELMREPPG